MGLNTLQRPTTPLTGAHQGSPAPGSSVLGKSTAPGRPCSASIRLGQASGTPEIPTALTPQDMWSIYDMPAVNVGQGQSIAIMGSGDSSTTVKDLAIFEAHHKLPKVPVDGHEHPGGRRLLRHGRQRRVGARHPGVERRRARQSRGEHLYFAQHLVDPDAEADFATWVV